MMICFAAWLLLIYIPGLYREGHDSHCICILKWSLSLWLLAYADDSVESSLITTQDHVGDSKLARLNLS